jgi:hypothetical protein
MLTASRPQYGQRSIIDRCDNKVPTDNFLGEFTKPPTPYRGHRKAQLEIAGAARLCISIPARDDHALRNGRLAGGSPIVSVERYFRSKRHTHVRASVRVSP